jgi:hypothetical protein
MLYLHEHNYVGCDQNTNLGPFRQRRWNCILRRFALATASHPGAGEHLTSDPCKGQRIRKARRKVKCHSSLNASIRRESRNSPT